MKKILFVLELMMSCLGTLKAQTTYHNYLDCSSEWRYVVHMGTSVGPYFDRFVTVYLDGDTTINGYYYYKQKIAYRDQDSVNIKYTNGYYLREDSNQNFIGTSYNVLGTTANIDTLYNFNKITQLNIGDSLPKVSHIGFLSVSYYPECVVTKVDSLFFGGRFLKMIYPVDTNFIKNCRVKPCLVEGVGAVFPDFCNYGCCDRPIEELYYYKKGTEQIAFNSNAFTYSLDSFPLPARTYACTLPIKLLSFNTKPQQNKVLLNWQTANEVNVSHINIQRSTNNKEFTTIGKANASCCEYSYTDNSLQSIVESRLYYRLEIVDKDGSKTYSSIQQITPNPKPSTLNIYPNPAKDIVTIECAGAKELLIIDYLGREISRYTRNDVNVQHQTINTKQLPKGIYLVKAIMNNGDIKTEKLVVE